MIFVCVNVSAITSPRIEPDREQCEDAYLLKFSDRTRVHVAQRERVLLTNRMARPEDLCVNERGFFEFAHHAVVDGV